MQAVIAVSAVVVMTTVIWGCAFLWNMKATTQLSVEEAGNNCPKHTSKLVTGELQLHRIK